MIKVKAGYLLETEQGDIPEAIGELFADMAHDDQAKFFDRVAEIAEGWSGDQGIQWSSMAEELTPRAKAVIVEMSKYMDPDPEGKG